MCISPMEHVRALNFNKNLPINSQGFPVDNIKFSWLGENQQQLFESPFPRQNMQSNSMFNQPINPNSFPQVYSNNNPNLYPQFAQDYGRSYVQPTFNQTINRNFPASNAQYLQPVYFDNNSYFPNSQNTTSNVFTFGSQRQKDIQIIENNEFIKQENRTEKKDNIAKTQFFSKANWFEGGRKTASPLRKGTVSVTKNLENLEKQHLETKRKTMPIILENNEDAMI